jgi:pimeloyl-ACP methyl ester carboxylesterase
MLEGVADYTKERVRSVDGTAIGYRRYGDGPGLILLHGGMKAAQHLFKLASALAADFQVSVPDRRGRGMSGPHGDQFTVQREVEDIQAIIDATGARFIFGHSSGGLVSLRTALVTPALTRVALYEPPLSINGSTPMAWVSRFDREIAAGRRAAALVTALKGTEMEPVFARLPRFVLAPVMALGLRAQRNEDGDAVPIVDLIPTEHFDMRIVQEMADTAAQYASLQTQVLLLGGTKGPEYLRIPLGELAVVLPRARRQTLPGLDHSGPEDDGGPLAVARALRSFFTDSGT